MATWKHTIPMGQSFLLVVLVNIAMWLVALASNPAEEYVLLEFSGIPEQSEARWEFESQIGHPLEQVDFECRWMDRSRRSNFPSVSRDSESSQPSGFFYHAECASESSRDEKENIDSIEAILDYFRKSDKWRVSGFGLTYRHAKQLELGVMASILFLAIPLAVTALVLRRISPRREVEEAISLACRKPWLLVVAPGAAIVTGMLASLIWQSEPASSELPPINEVGPAIALSVILILPVFEESVFRQWLYTRTTNRLPVILAGAGNAWFFMLAHIFNPPASSGPSYLLVMFVMGLVFFWLRHRFRSFGLAALAHITNNAFFVLVAAITS